MDLPAGVLADGFSPGDDHASRVSNTFTWGIDVGESKVAVAWVDDADQGVRALHIGSPRGARRLALLARAVEDLARSLATDHPPETVFVEQPVGKFANPHLMASWGVVQSSLYRTLEGMYPFPCSVIPMTPPAWRHAIGLPGNAAKDVVAAWALGHGYTDGDQDCADALGVAFAGRAATR